MAGIHKYLWEIGPMSGEFLFNRCCEIYFLFLLNTNGIKWHIENAQTVAIFRRSLPLEAILDRTQPPPPTATAAVDVPAKVFAVLVSNREGEKQHRKHICD